MVGQRPDSCGSSQPITRKHPTKTTMMHSALIEVNWTTWIIIIALATRPYRSWAQLLPPWAHFSTLSSKNRLCLYASFSINHHTDALSEIRSSGKPNNNERLRSLSPPTSSHERFADALIATHSSRNAQHSDSTTLEEENIAGFHCFCASPFTWFACSSNK